MCGLSSDVYCWEEAKEISASGVERPAMYGRPYMYCHQGQGSSDRSQCKTDGSFWFEIGFSSMAFTERDLGTTYRWKVRTGRFSPDIFMLGDTQKIVVTGDATSGWAVEIWAKPALKAYKNGCFTSTACDDTSVADSVQYAISGYMRTLGIGVARNSWPSVETEALRDSLRGTFISTNGMTQQWTFAADTFNVSAFGPHFLTDGKTVGPGFVRVFLPEAYIVKQRGYSSVSEVTAENVAVTVRGQKTVPVIAAKDGGLLVDTGVTHFSAPNPTVKVLPGPLLSGATSNSSVAPQLSGIASTTPVRTGEGDARGVTGSTAAKGAATPSLRRGSSIALTSIYRSKSRETIRWTSRGQCIVKGARVVALKKPGNCVVTASAKRGNRLVVVTRKTLKVV